MTIRVVNLDQTDQAIFTRRFADCVILTHDGKLLLQQRTAWQTRPGTVVAFGGHVEIDETVLQALIRELREELGAVVDPNDVIFLAAITEDFTNHTAIIHGHFWHDRDGTITGCYEGEAAYFNSLTNALAHPKIMDYLQWLLEECRRHNFLGLSL